MEIVQDYCNYIQITDGELEDLRDEIDDLMSAITTEDEQNFQTILSLHLAIESWIVDG